MYTPHKIVLTNFGSHKSTEYIFPDSQTTLLCGINETDQGQKSNGSGKSWIIEAIFYSLIGSALRKVNDKDLIYNGDKFAEVQIELDNRVLDQKLTIWRKIYSNTKSGELRVFVNDQEQTDIPSVNEGNKFILEQLGLSREDIVDYFIISKEKYTSFFNSSDTAKKSLINRFSKADMIDPVDKSISDDIGKAQNEQDGLQREIDANNARIGVYIETLENSKDNTKQLVEQHTQTINDNTKEIEQLKQVIDSDKSIVQSESIQIKSAEEALSKNEPKLQQLKATQREYEELLNDIERHLSNEVECPKCNHKFSFKDKTIALTELRENLPIVQDSIKDILLEYQIVDNQMQEARQVLNLAKSNKEESQYNITRNERKITSLEQENISLRDSIEKLKSSSGDSEIFDKIEVLERQNRGNQVKLDQATKEITSYHEWLINFKRFKGYLANQSLSAIESYANFYLQQLKSNITIVIEGYKEIKGGKEIREKINVNIFKDGEDNGSFYKLSGGEKARVEIAIILSMQKLINIATQGRGLNFIVLDEILESLDSEGLYLLLNSLNTLNLNILLITQNIDVNYQHTIFVKKLNKVSQIV